MTSARWQSRKPWRLLPHKHTNSATVHEQLNFVRNSQTKWKALTLCTNVKPDSPKPVGTFRTPCHQSPCPQHSTRNQGDHLSSQLLQRKEELVCTSSTPAFPRGLPRGMASVLQDLELWQVWHNLATCRRMESAV